MATHEKSHKTFRCPTCGHNRPLDQECQGSSLSPRNIELMQALYPRWDGALTCRADVRRSQVHGLRGQLEADRGSMSELDETVLARMSENALLARNLEDTVTTFGARVADRVAQFGGSWAFIGLFGGVLLAWMILNVLLAVKAFDPYPFILLNLVLSSLAALQAPIIMMSQNRASEKDRQHAEHDYQVNLKAELEVQLLNEKLDRILHEWPKLVQLQELQMEMLEELGEPKSKK